jgi:hypothetical protein
MTLDDHVGNARRHPVTGMPALVAALRANPSLTKEAKARLASYATFSVDRLSACWISRTTQQTLKAALAQAPSPEVPVGATNV